MILGVDPRNDYAFKRVFGSARQSNILVHMLNAVLKPPPGRRVESVEILNPFVEPVVLDEKLSILDVRARDQGGRQFNAEMQMALHGYFSARVLYYWAKLYSGQLEKGDEYYELRPTISICFLDALLFPEVEEYHIPFELYSPHQHIAFNDHLRLHLFQLPNFHKTADQLSDPLDLWLYFLNNGRELDTDHLPASLGVPEVHQAIEVLRMLTQDEIERERYEARERARRDAAAWRHTLQVLQEERDRARSESERARNESERARTESERAEREVNEKIVAQIRFCEQLLQLTPIADAQLAAMSREELERTAGALQQQVLAQQR